jgi:hypothetical protein
MPVTRNFYVSHQWLRELKRWGAGTVVGVYFRLADDVPVSVGHYNSPHVAMTAAEAVKLIMAAEQRDPKAARASDVVRDLRTSGALPSSPEGYEVIVSRAIEPSQILRVKALPQVVGWRYQPGAHGTRPCTCLCCSGRGTYGIRKLVSSVERAEAAGKPTKAIIFGRDEASDRRVERLRREREVRRALKAADRQGPAKNAGA